MFTQDHEYITTLRTVTEPLKLFVLLLNIQIGLTKQNVQIAIARNRIAAHSFAHEKKFYQQTADDLLARI